MNEKTLSSDLIYDGKIIRVKRDTVELSSKQTSIREVVHNDGGVCVLALTKDNQIILVKQFRYPSKEILYELAGGKAETGEDLVEAGMRELKEETGYISNKVEYFGYLYPTVAYSDEVIHLVIAKDCVYEAKCLDDGEFTEVILLKFEEAIKMVLNNEIKDAKTIIAILKYDKIK